MTKAGGFQTQNLLTQSEIESLLSEHKHDQEIWTAMLNGRDLSHLRDVSETETRELQTQQAYASVTMSVSIQEGKEMPAPSCLTWHLMSKEQLAVREQRYQEMLKLESQTSPDTSTPPQDSPVSLQGTSSQEQESQHK